MSSSMVLSIHSVYAASIYSGEKRFEYRTCRPSRNVEYIALYETGKVGAVTGVARVIEILEGTPEEIWERTKAYAGITRERFMQYFAGKAKAVAYLLGEVCRFAQSITLSELGLIRAPQSFQYLEPGLTAVLLDHSHGAIDKLG